MERVPWLCVVNLDTGEIFAVLHRVRAIGIAAFVLGGILIVLTVFMTTNYLVSRLEVKRRNILFLDTQLRQTSTMASSMPLVSGFVREINDTMATIDGAARWIQDLIQTDIPEGKGTHEILESLNQIKSEVKRTSKLTDRILNLTRHTVPIIKELQVNEVLDDVLELLERELRFNNIKVTQDYDDHLPLIRSDPPQLRQVFQNILVHSISSIQKDGEIVVSTRRRTGGATVTVTDNGPGIPKEQLEKIFDPSFVPRPGETGTGLGLSLSAGILGKLGGRISVQSEPGKGTSFIVELPFHARGSNSQQTY
jgi:two-component system NtrC family sensor kinase